LSLARAEPVNATIPRDAHDPMERKSKKRIESLSFGPNLHKNVLNHFFRILRVPEGVNGKGE
jgi:hypothetical protein